ncbi:zinc ABC transporter permease [Vibrio galatheae]|uniref:Zinc ABC transporter permease n=1 Tax=Vibrio galatheae TaxID=579748 RepID=A0A0F4NJ74_9VIBR|nr:DUF2878 domain-containing protein [Vibrio galatheae]KJY83215.1 zinc ABC transporter permease [Vibrio galatheae]
MTRILLVSTWFQIVWFCAVIGNDNWQPLTLLLVTATLVISALKTTINWYKYSLIVTLGVAVDFTNSSFGLFQFEAQQFPLWLVALWMIFAWYAHFLYPMLSQYPLAVVSIVGGIGGTLSYCAGESLGAVVFGASIFTMTAILLVEWSLIIALVIKVYGYENSNVSRGLSRFSK